MKTKGAARTVRLILCALLCMALAVPLAGTALAFSDEGAEPASGLAIRITPPGGWAERLAEVEVCITDHTGLGLQSAQVRTGGGRWRDLAGALERTENRYCCVVELTENGAVEVQAVGLDGKTYEKSQYVSCFQTGSASASGPEAEPGTAEKPSVPPGGQGTVIDSATGTAAESGREFFTISTPDEHVFYLVIDRKREGENVYFLNAVTESDLMALAEKDTDQSGGVSAVPEPEPVCTCKDKCVPGAVQTACPVCMLAWKDCAGTAPAGADADTAPEQAEKGGGAMALVVVVALAAGGAGFYLKIYKPRKELEDAEDLDELTGGPEEAVNEDEPDFPAGYHYDEDGGE